MKKTSGQRFAVIGLGCRLPGNSNSPETYFNNLKEKRDCIVKIPKERFNADYYFSLHEKHPGRVVSNEAGLMDFFFDFDNKAFQISKKEALVQDVQQKILLETTLNAFEDANIKYEGENIGVFIGSTQTGYVKHAIEHPYFMNEYSASGTAMSIHANMISYKFDLRGPSFHLDTACSSSGYAMFTACNALENGHCDAAVVGGIQIMLDPYIMIAFGRLGVLTTAGRCRSFDEKANGFVRSEGCGISIVKRLEDAQRDGDNIYCIIRACTANSDGALSPSLTTPSPEAQGAALKECLRRADVDPLDVFFLEAHCTGTKVGDPAEINGAGRVLGKGRKDGEILRVGSVKSNIGHTECSAYISSLIKCCMMYRNGLLVPNILFENPNPKIKFKKYHLRVQTECEKFNPEGTLMVLSSFGFGGSNTCCVLEGVEKPSNSNRSSTRPLPPPYMYMLYGRTKDGLENRKQQMIEYSKNKVKPEEQARLMYTLNSSVPQKDYLSFAYGIGNTLHEARWSDPIRKPDEKEKIIFVFSGQGPQNLKMGRGLYKIYPVFRNMIDRCDKYYKKISGVSMINDIGLFGDKVGKVENVNKIENTLPSLIFIQIALFELWKSFGIHPDAVLGHSFGEMCASYAAGACSVETILNVAYTRVKIVSQMKALGKMCAIGASKDEVLRMIKEHKLPKLWIAANNSPIAVSVGGIPESVFKIRDICEKKGLFCRVLNINNAFHTPLINDVVDLAMNLFGKAVDGYGKGTIPMISTTYARKIWTTEFTAQYFWDNISHCVQFRDAIETSMKKYGENVIFLELAPHPVLSYSIRQCGSDKIVGSINRKMDEVTSLMQNIGKIRAFGYEINWEAITGKYDRILSMPPYPFARERLFFEHEFYKRQRLVNEREKMPTMLGRKMHTVEESWENFISDRTYPWLTGHVVQSAVVMPAACYTEMFLELCQTRCLKNVKYLTAMNVPVEEEFQYAIMRTLMKEDRMEVFSKRTGDSEDYTLQSFGSPCNEIQKPVYTPESIESLKKRLNYRIFDRKQVYQRLAEINLFYGEDFQNIMEIYQGDEEAYMVIRTDHLPQKNYVIHPTVLDATFHGAIGTIRTVVETFIPESIERMTVYTNKYPARVNVYCRLLEKSREHFLGDIVMFNDEGNVLMEILGFRCNILQQKEPEPKIHYTYNWQTKETPKFDFPEFKKEVKPLWRDILSKMDHVNYYMRRKLIDGLKQVEKIDEESLSLERRRYMKWARKFIEQTKDLDVIRPIPLSDIKGFEMEAALITRVGENWFPLQMNQNNEVSNIMFGDDLIDNFYFDSISMKPVIEHFNDMFKDYLDELIGRQGRVLRILEVGSGTGAMARGIFPMLKNYKGMVEFFYTDISSSFFKTAKSLFKDYPFVRFQALDASKEFSEQGIDDHSIDVVVAYDVVHAIDVVENGIKHCQKCLTPGGIFALLEITNCPAYFDFIFGVFKGWLHFKDWRKDHCYFSRSEWKELLERLGFGEIEFFGCPEEVHSVIIGRKQKSLEEKPLENIIRYNDLKSEPYHLIEVIKENIANENRRKKAKKQTEETEGESEKDDSISHSLIVEVEESKTHPYVAEIYGIAKTCICEFPHWNVKLLDFEKECSTEERERIVKNVIQHPSLYEDDCQIRGGKILVPRLVKVDPVEAKVEKGKPFRLVQEEGVLNKISVSYRHFQLPILKDDEVIVEVKYSALNFKDVLLAMNVIKINPMLGTDFSGIIVDVGPKVTRFQIGDEVFGLAKHTFSSHAMTYEACLAKKPKNLSFRDASCIPTVYLTSYFSLIVRANIQEGEKVLIHSGTGGIGQSAIQLAKWKKAEVYATVGTMEKREYLKKKYGVQHFGNSHDNTWKKDIMASSKGGVDVVLNSLKGEHIQDGMDVLNPLGRFVEIGKQDILENSKLGMLSFLKSISFISVHLDELGLDKKRRKLITPVLVHIAELFKKGVLKPIVDREFSCREVVDAFDYIKNNKHKGKVTVNMDSLPTKVGRPLSVFAPEATYVISGGLGAVGFRMLQWMCVRGARNVALLSRSGRMTKNQIRTINELNEKFDRRIIVSKCDCTVKESVETMYKELKTKGFPPVRGIFHLAMVLHDTPIQFMTKEIYQKVVDAKKMGSLNLVQPFGPKDLDFVVFFSSISTVLCNPEQANYIAGNSFSESYARQLKEKGYKAHVINLGAVVDVGLIAEQVLLRKVMRSKNIMSDAMTASQVNHSVREMLEGSNDVVQHCPSFSFEGVSERFPKLRKLFSHLFEFKEEQEESTSKTDLSYESLNEILKKMLSLDDDIDGDERLTTYGVDSIQSIELTSILESKFQVKTISQMDILSGITINQIIKRS